jgi:UPF0716 protein FxsA
MSSADRSLPKDEPDGRAPRSPIPAYRTHAAIIQIKGRHTYVVGCIPAPIDNPPVKKATLPTMRISAIPLLLLSLPLFEIAGFVFVGRLIGVLPTLALVIATGIAGTILLRVQGFGILQRIRREVQAGRDPSRELAHGVMVLIAGVLLLIPGFFTDILGLLLFLSPVRDLGWRLVRSRVGLVAGFGLPGGGFDPPGSDKHGKTINLNADEYSTPPKGDAPWRRLDHD